jgi:hypothetical protein
MLLSANLNNILSFSAYYPLPEGGSKAQSDRAPALLVQAAAIKNYPVKATANIACRDGTLKVQCRKPIVWIARPDTTGTESRMSPNVMGLAPTASMVKVGL